MPEHIGRQVSVGLGLESVPGTAVAPSHWPRHMKLGFQRRKSTVSNTSAMGRMEEANDSAVVEEWADGPLEAKVYDLSIGVLLANMFGAPVTTDNPDSNPAVKDHTFDIAQTNVAKTMTVTRLDQNSNRRHAMGTLETLEFTAEQGNWVMVNGQIMALAGTSGADTAAYAAENAFTSKHVVTKIASNVAGLAGATPPALKRVKLTIKRGVTRETPLGTATPTSFDLDKYTIEGEILAKYANTTYDDLAFTNTQQALQIAFRNTDVTIGAAANPALVFTLPKLRLDFEMSDDLDKTIEQTLKFRGEFDTTAGYAIRAVLTNTQASY